MHKIKAKYYKNNNGKSQALTEQREMFFVFVAVSSRKRYGHVDAEAFDFGGSYSFVFSLPQLEVYSAADGARE